MAPRNPFLFTDVAPQPTPGAAPMLELTASDGTGLQLVSLSARIAVEEPLAFTELHLVFQNPEPRQLEGRFRIGLPSGAVISRFAMRVGSQWQEGEVVERQAARRAYEDFLHRQQDPALLEHEAGNEFSARIFPIEPRGQKELIVSHSHEMARPGVPYRLPLVGLPALGNLDIRALVGRSAAGQLGSSLGGTSSNWQVVEVKKSNWKPDADFELTPPLSGRAGLRHGNLALLRVRPELPVEPVAIPSLLVLVDTSASRALGLDRQIEIIEALARGLAQGTGPEVPLAVACFDQSVHLTFEGGAGGFSALEARRIIDRLALGASDLAGALRWAAQRKGARYERVLLVSDGVATAGDTDPAKIAEAARALQAAGVTRLDALAVGGLRDDASLRRLVTAGLPADGTVCDGDLTPPEIALKLTFATRSGIKVEVPGASWVWPTRLDGVQPGDVTLVYADIPEQQPAAVLLDGNPMGGVAPLEPVERPLLERAWVKARIERLEDLRARPETDQDVREGLKKQIIDLSVKHRVLSPYTALLVLETEADYARFHIDRNALADILTVGLGGLEVLHRSAVSSPPSPPLQKPVPARPMARSGAKKAKRSSNDAFGGERAAMPRSVDDGNDGDDLALSEEVAAPEGEVLYSLASLVSDSEISAESLAGPPLAARLMDDDMPSEASPDEERTMARSTPMPASAPQSRAAPAPMPASAPQSRAAPAPMPASAPQSRAASADAVSPLRRLAGAVMDVFSRREEPREGSSPPANRPPPAAAMPPMAAPAPMPQRPASPAGPLAPQPAAPPPPAVEALRLETTFDPRFPKSESWSGPFREVMHLVLSRNGQQALARALRWRAEAPGDVLALVAMGEAAEALGNVDLAARAYGAILDLFPSRADLRRFAGQRLERVAESALDLAIDTYRKAVESRPDHPSSHRLLGMALLRAGRPAEAFEAIAAGQGRQYPPKFPGVDRILTEDLGLVAAAWIRAEPQRREDILARLQKAGAQLADGPSVRFVLVWETDANDVDFHIHDAAGGHAYFREKQLPSGGELYADVTQGYGPECFTISKPPASRAYPYRLQAHYYRRGPMGYGMGTLQILEHDGQGCFAFEDRPYVVMADGAYVELGAVGGPLPLR